MRYETYLVVGGAGFVGSHVVDSLIYRGAKRVVVIDNMFLGKMQNLNWAGENGDLAVYKEDARYLTAMENIIDREKPEVVLNLAVKCLPYGFVDPEGSFMTGVEIAHNLVNLLRKKKYQRLLHFSSSEAYGTAETVPMNEDHPLNPTTPYGAGKASADLLLMSYHRLFNLETSIIRPFNLYGERQNMEAYAAVIPLTIWRILSGKKPIIEGDGLQTRDFTYVRDLADISLRMLECDNAIGKVINIGSGSEVNVRTLIRKICQLLKYPLDEVEHKKERPSDVRRLLADTTKAKKILDYSPSTCLDEGIETTIEWFKSKKKDLEKCQS